ncbi:hypothetical protein JR316_0012631 [Psilocybe cubensis]|uniref:Uncharacterized protein n=2 Tax=Psilocybe cubensis TaxID=181762 RepID=A0ACB8GJ16_PSICU|nr:hypothetical protein JR316_0012631 [Psilocybe cubensis]KAH9475516.1 hypothetical protein JR316_0012631 [Psilocybe cubensis]
MALPPGQDVQAMFVVALIYGLYLSTLFHCLRWLIFTDEGWKARSRISWTLVTITIAIWVLSTISKVLQLIGAVHVADHASKPSTTTSQEYTGSTALPWMSVAICTDSNLTTLLADSVLIYRCWIVYNNSKRVITFPVFLWVGGLMLTGLQAYWQIVQSASIAGTWQPVNMQVGPGTILTPFWASTILLNSYATIMIVRKISSVSKKSEAGGTSVSALRFTMRVLVESGALYLTTAIAHFVVWWTPNAFAISIISDMNLGVTGIAFNLILIRVAQRRVDEEKSSDFHGRIGAISSIRFNQSIGESKEIDTVERTPTIDIEAGTSHEINQCVETV